MRLHSLSLIVMVFLLLYIGRSVIEFVYLCKNPIRLHENVIYGENYVIYVAYI